MNHCETKKIIEWNSKKTESAESSTLKNAFISMMAIPKLFIIFYAVIISNHLENYNFLNYQQSSKDWICISWLKINTKIL